MIVSKSEPITLIGGGDVTNACIETALSLTSTLIAADSGADRALRFGQMPDAVIGDFDSLSNNAKARIPSDRLHHVPEQDSTDFEKALRAVSSPLIIGIGFGGARVDHQLAVFNALVRYPEKRCILFGPHEIAFLCPPSLRLDLQHGTTVSLFPLGAVEGVSDGLQWPVGGLHFAPDGQIGTSNRALGSIDVAFTAPKMLMMLPSRTVEHVADRLLNTASAWSGA